MKFTTIVFSVALIAGAVAQSTTETVVVTTTTATSNTANTGTTTIIPIPTETNSSYGPEVDECMTDCKQGDVGCLATCLGNPNPTEEQVNETNKCSAACEQGDGSEEQTKAYADCQWDCVVKYFLPNSSLVPTVGGTKTSGDETGTQTAPGTTTVIETDSEGNPTKTVVNDDSTATTSSTSTPSTTDDGSSAPAKVYGASFAGAAAAFAAFLAL